MSEKMSVQVAGITCAGCEQRAATVLRRLDGVAEATADHRTGQVTVIVAVGRTVDPEQVAARLTAAGFQPQPEVSP